MSPSGAFKLTPKTNYGLTEASSTTPIKPCATWKKSRLGFVEAIEHRTANRLLRSNGSRAPKPVSYSQLSDMKLNGLSTPKGQAELSTPKGQTGLSTSKGQTCRSTYRGLTGRSTHTDKPCTSSTTLKRSNTCKALLAQLDTIDDMLETADTNPIKSYIHYSTIDYATKLDKAKLTAQLGAEQAKAERKRRWKYAKLNLNKDDGHLTSKEIKEIVGQWRSNMKRFIFK